MKRVTTNLILIAAVGMGTPAAAQTANENAVFAKAVTASAKSGRAHIYQCKGASGAFDQDDHHPTELARIAKEMANGDEIVVAKRFGCRRSNDAGPSDAFSGGNLLAIGPRTTDAIWLVGEVSENYPQSTGYTFEAIVRIPIAPSAAAAAPASKIVKSGSSVMLAAASEADASYMKKVGSRKMAGSDEGSGYDVCPSEGAVTVVLDAGGVAPQDIRGERMEELMHTKKCVQGDHLLTGIKARRYVSSMGTYWYGAKGIENGHPVDVIVWVN